MGISQLFSQIIVPSAGTGLPQAGEFYWVPAPDTRFHVLESKRATPEAHTRVDFVLKPFDSKRHYLEKEHLPVKLLSIDEHSEALLFKSKLRPCLVLGSGYVADHDTLTSAPDKRQAKVLGEPCYLVAPMQSANSPAKPSGPFPPEMVVRIKMLFYPHLCWLPDFQQQGPGSILRLDRIFPSHLGVGIRRCGFRVHDDVMEILQAQVASVLGIEMNQDLVEHLQATKALLKDCAPEKASP